MNKQEIQKVEGIKLPKNAGLFYIPASKTYVLRHYDTNVLRIVKRGENSEDGYIIIFGDEVEGNNISATTRNAIMAVDYYLNNDYTFSLNVKSTNNNKFTQELRGCSRDYIKEVTKRYNKADWNAIAEEIAATEGAN